MLKFTKLSDFLDDLSIGAKAIWFAAMLIGFLAAAVPFGKAFLGMPGQFNTHASQTAEQTKILKEMLCLQIADRRKTDWTVCLDAAN